MTEEKSNSLTILKRFIENEIANSDDAYQLTVAEMQSVFENAIKAIEEVSGEKVDIDEFNHFLKFYKIMKVVEKVSEELRVEKYMKDMKGRH